MKLVALALCLPVVACQRAPGEEAPRSEPERTRIVAEISGSPDVSRTAPPAAPVEAAPAECSGGCSCGGGCSGGAELAEPAAAVPADAVWAELQVTGMHCGGCARRIKKALAGVDGVYGVEVDVGTRTVKVAMAPGKDPLAVAAPAIDALGYRVAR
jgi:copper chaperone CopZ